MSDKIRVKKIFRTMYIQNLSDLLKTFSNVKIDNQKLNGNKTKQGIIT